MRSLPAGITDMLAVVGIVIAGRNLALAEEEVSTAATLVLIVVGLMVVAGASIPFNRFRAAITGACVAGIVFCCVFLHELFVLIPLSMPAVIMLICAAASATAVFWTLRFVFMHITDRRRHNG